MIRKWLCGTICCALLSFWVPVHAEECGLITTWNSDDAVYFTSQETSVYAFDNTPFPIPSLGGAMVTSIQFSLSGGPFIRVWSHENDAAAQTSLENYLATISAGRVHNYGEYFLIYKVDDDGMVNSVDLAANYRGSLVKMETYFIDKRSLSEQVPIYESWFGQVKALINSKCGTIGNPPTIALLPSPAQGLAFQISIFENRVFKIKASDPDGRADLDWATFKVFVAGVDKTSHFISVLTSLPGAIGGESDATSQTFAIRVNPDRFMAEENLFNIQWNGYWPVSLEICDRSGKCGRSDYSIYFGPFLQPNGGTPDTISLVFSCEGSAFDVGELVGGNFGHDCRGCDIYFGITRPDVPSFLVTWTNPNFWSQDQIEPIFSKLDFPAGSFFRVKGFTYPDLWMTEGSTGPPETMRFERLSLYNLHAFILDPEATGVYLSTVGFQLYCK